MKGNRLEAIAQIIKEHPIATQEELLTLLKARGFNVTQATISRDIKTLRLSKIIDASGNIRYATPGNTPTPDQVDMYRMILRESVLTIAIAGNIIVIKCQTGMANAACAALDAMQLDHIVGTIAGDDTIFVAIDTLEDAHSIMRKLNQIV